MFYASVGHIQEADFERAIRNRGTKCALELSHDMVGTPEQENGKVSLSENPANSQITSTEVTKR